MSQPRALAVGSTLPSLTAPELLHTATHSVAVLGLGYVGLPTALALHAAGSSVIGVDIDPERVRAIQASAVDVSDTDLATLRDALVGDRLTLTTTADEIEAADAVIICAPTPIDADRQPNPTALRAACASAVAAARPGQTIVLTSTTYVGCTRELLVEPIEARGLEIGVDVAIAFSPERILPGVPSADPREVPRVLGGATTACTLHALSVLSPTTSSLHPVSSLEAAEFTKLYENTFRAVNLAFANEMAGVCGHLGLDPVEIVDAAATKPYGFLAHYPGPGVGGHCIPVDPHYLLARLHGSGIRTPITENAMDAIAERPGVVAARALELLRERGIAPVDARVLIVGMAYKPGVADARESPGVAIADGLEQCGVAEVSYHDPVVPSVRLSSRRILRSVGVPKADMFDLVIIATLHERPRQPWLADSGHVLDATYRASAGRTRHLV